MIEKWVPSIGEVVIADRHKLINPYYIRVAVVTKVEQAYRGEQYITTNAGLFELEDIRPLNSDDHIINQKFLNQYLENIKVFIKSEKNRVKQDRLELKNFEENIKSWEKSFYEAGFEV